MQLHRHGVCVIGMCDAQAMKWYVYQREQSNGQPCGNKVQSQALWRDPGCGHHLGGIYIG